MASERFLQAASSGETAVVASMLRNPDLDSPGKRALLEATTPQGHCALHVAALNGHAGVVNMLIKAGADSQAKTRFGKTPLACAESGNHHEVIKLLTPEKAPARRVLRRRPRRRRRVVVVVVVDAAARPVPHDAGGQRAALGGHLGARVDRRPRGRPGPLAAAHQREGALAGGLRAGWDLSATAPRTNVICL